MKKLKEYISFAVMLGMMFLYGAVPALAQNVSAGANVQFKAGLPAVRERAASGSEQGLGQKIQNEVRANDGQGKPDVTAIRLQARVRVAEVFSRLSANLSQITNRIQSRAEKMKADGIDVSAEVDLIAKAQADITAANGFVAEIKTKAQAGAALSEIRTIITSLKNSLKEAHGYLVAAVQGLKAKLNASQQSNINTGLNMGVGAGASASASASQ